MIFKCVSDAYILTEYHSSCLVDKQIMKDNKIKSQYEYRKFLQENAEKIMEINRKKSQSSVIKF